MKMLYAPLPPEGWDYWLKTETLGNFIGVWFVIGALFIVYLHQKENQIRSLRPYLIVSVVGSMLAYILFIVGINGDRTQYQVYLDNSFKLKTFSGVIESVGYEYRAWPGHRSSHDDDYLWDVFTITTKDQEWSVLWDIQTREAFGVNQPPCYKGDIYSLVAPHVGKEIKLRYFSFISSYHKTSSLYSKCVVDIQVSEHKVNG